MGRTMHVEGELVVHPVKPGWGPGKVLRVDGPVVTVYFRDYEAKDPHDAVRKINVDKVALERSPTQSDPMLDNLPPYRDGEFERRPRKRVTFEQAVGEFQKEFPLYFEDPRYIGDLKEGERAYKWAAHELYVEALGGGELERLLATGDVNAARQRLLTVEGRVNLLSVFEKAAFRGAMTDDAAAEAYLHALGELLRSGDPERDTFTSYLRAVEALPTTGKTDPAKWPVATLLPYLADPSRFAFLKPEMTQDCAARLTFELDYSPRLNWGTYEKVLEMSRYMLDHLRQYGAKDFIDVQSFIFVIGGGWDEA